MTVREDVGWGQGYSIGVRVDNIICLLAMPTNAGTPSTPAPAMMPSAKARVASGCAAARTFSRKRLVLGSPAAKTSFPASCADATDSRHHFKQQLMSNSSGTYNVWLAPN